MKKSFFEYYTLTDSEKKHIWNSSYFVFDTNVLLDLYRVSTKTRDTLLQAMKECKGKVFLPHQIALEFSKQRPTNIFKTFNIPSKLESEKEKFIKYILNETRLKKNDKIITELDLSITKSLQKINDEIKLPFDILSEDTIIDAIFNLFDKKVGEKYTEEKMKTIQEEGVKRYNNKIPPGYKDAGKQENEYGDLIVWNQIIDFAIKNNTNIIFVTNDVKEDWVNVVNGKSLGPRPELLREFFDKTNKQYMSYQSDQFIKYALNIDSDNEAILEIRNLPNDNMNYTPHKYQIANCEIDTDVIFAKNIINKLETLNAILLNSYKERGISEKNIDFLYMFCDMLNKPESFFFNDELNQSLLNLKNQLKFILELQSIYFSPINNLDYYRLEKVRNEKGIPDDERYYNELKMYSEAIDSFLNLSRNFRVLIKKILFL